MQNTLSCPPNLLTHGINSVIMNLFSTEKAHLFLELTFSVIKYIFCYKEGIVMETDLYPPKNMSDIEYSVITSDAIECFDCNLGKL